MSAEPRGDVRETTGSDAPFTVRDDVTTARPRRGASALLVRCALLACIAALPLAFNAWIDPARLLGAPRDEKAIANALLAGHDVTDIGNYDDRAIQRLLAHGRTQRPDVLVLGSSRTQPVPASAFPGQRVYNGSVSGGRLDDMLAVYALYDAPSMRPKRVIINLDPWTLQDPGDDVTWRSLLDERAAMLDTLGVHTSPLRDRLALHVATFKRLASPEYFRLALFSLRQHGVAGIRYRVTDTAQNDDKTMTPDGSLVWSRTSQRDAERIAMRYADELLASDSRYMGLGGPGEREQAVRLERFLRLLRARGIHVTVLLLPYHPLVYRAFAARADHPLLKAEARYRALIDRVGALGVSSYDPDVMHVTEHDFFDEAHLRPEFFDRLFHGPTM